ncbi:MAG: 2-oxoacid ferredoxin oxidoreductase [Methanophagales archaeon ANME-1-THS]|nr:MAG: 2-oxoacid ferredoxin oxidoreductase [Methanophagales archaeon ANME-1-THS]
MVAIEEYQSDAENQWCPGCPNFGILSALKNALVKLAKKPEEICLVSGIGQAAKLPHYLRCNFFNGLHGRALPVATAIRVVNPELTTIVVTGDGDCYGEGGNHFMHTFRRNPDMTLIVHNNQIYGLTKGQASPTTELGDRTRLQFEGVKLAPLQPLALAILQGCPFVARGFAGDIPHLSDLFVEAIRFKGFSYVDVIQPCISWGTHPVSWYRERIYKLPPDYNPHQVDGALKKAIEWGDRIPIGILYHDDTPRHVFGDYFRAQIHDGTLTELGFPPRDALDELLEGFGASKLKNKR